MPANGGEYFLPVKSRTSPVKLGAGTIPSGFTCRKGSSSMNCPGPVKIKSPYGELDAEWTVSGAEIVMNQTLEIRDQVASPSEYADVRGFFDKLAGAEAAPIVFVKQ